MNERIRKAMAERETPIMQKVRAGYIEHVESWVKELVVEMAKKQGRPEKEGLIDPEILQTVAKQMLDSSAIYAIQTGMPMKDFLEYAADSYHLYDFFIREAAGDPKTARMLSLMVQKKVTSRA